MPARDAQGLSPRVRGNRPQRGQVEHVGRSIPARAGEPVNMESRGSDKRVYPRACGGTRSVPHSAFWLSGLSPRVRGNRLRCARRCLWLGSIPARAGEPNPSSNSPTASTVYPRACGGTLMRARVFRVSCGLSPRVRGNLALHHGGLTGVGSIPARAGEPKREPGHRIRVAVYPRACGGTYSVSWLTLPLHGLSPRVRGNRDGSALSVIRRGSIPARAGEPLPFQGHGEMSPVYPRACGGTEFQRVVLMTAVGLSPRVRGNPSHHRQSPEPHGSIPARAGEPSPLWAAASTSAVYPRACGGTVHAPGLKGIQGGLSPRVRGNLPGSGRVVGSAGSIPARAGEPPGSWR